LNQNIENAKKEKMGMLCGVIWKAAWHPMMVITPYALGWGTYGWVDARAVEDI